MVTDLWLHVVLRNWVLFKSLGRTEQSRAGFLWHWWGQVDAAWPSGRDGIQASLLATTDIVEGAYCHLVGMEFPDLLWCYQVWWGWARCFLWGWLQWAVIVSECFVLLGYPGPGSLARGSWLLLRVVYISWHFWVASFSSTYSEIYEAKRKPRTQSCVFLWAPRSLPSLSPLHLSESYVLFCFKCNMFLAAFSGQQKSCLCF